VLFSVYSPSLIASVHLRPIQNSRPIKCTVVFSFDSYIITQSITTRFGTLIVATIYLQLIQNRYMFPSFTVLQCNHQHCVQPVASDVEVVGYL